MKVHDSLVFFGVALVIMVRPVFATEPNLSHLNTIPAHHSKNIDVHYTAEAYRYYPNNNKFNIHQPILYDKDIWLYGSKRELEKHESSKIPEGLKSRLEYRADCHSFISDKQTLAHYQAKVERLAKNQNAIVRLTCVNVSNNGFRKKVVGGHVGYMYRVYNAELPIWYNFDVRPLNNNDYLIGNVRNK